MRQTNKDGTPGNNPPKNIRPNVAPPKIVINVAPGEVNDEPGQTVRLEEVIKSIETMWLTLRTLSTVFPNMEKRLGKNIAKLKILKDELKESK